MNIAKKDIVKNINKESLLTITDGTILLESFLLFIKKQAKSNKVKFTRSKMGKKFVETVDRMIGEVPQAVSLKLPKLKKISGGQTGAIKPPQQPKVKDIIKLPKLRKM